MVETETGARYAFATETGAYSAAAIGRMTRSTCAGSPLSVELTHASTDACSCFTVHVTKGDHRDQPVPGEQRRSRCSGPDRTGSRRPRLRPCSPGRSGPEHRTGGPGAAAIGESPRWTRPTRSPRPPAGETVPGSVTMSARPFSSGPPEYIPSEHPPGCHRRGRADWIVLTGPNQGQVRNSLAHLPEKCSSPNSPGSVGTPKPHDGGRPPGMGEARNGNNAPYLFAPADDATKALAAQGQRPQLDQVTSATSKAPAEILRPGALATCPPTR